MKRRQAYAAVGALVIGAGVAVAATRPDGQQGVRAGNAAPAPATLLRADTGLYPRVVRLAHSGSANGRVIASVVTFSGNAGIGSVYESVDAGKTFRQIGSIADSSGSGGKGMCCGTLYELPKKVGANGNGRTLFVGTKGGTGTWRAVPAPVAAPDARNDYCPNYSSALLPATTGTSVLEIATDYAGKVCTPYFTTAATS